MSWPMKLTWLFCATLCICLAGCGDSQREGVALRPFKTLAEAKSKVKEGMSRQQVQELLGEPDLILDFVGRPRLSADIGQGVEIEYHYRMWNPSNPEMLGDLQIPFHKVTGLVRGAKITEPQ